MDQLSTLEDVTLRKMFGGAGVFSRGKVFGIVAGDSLYFKVDDSNRDRYIKAGSEQFKPFPDKEMYMPYYRVPDGVLDDPEALCDWALKSIEIPPSRKSRK